MIFHTEEEFLANMKVGDIYWQVGSFLGAVTKPNGPHRIVSIYEAVDPMTSGRSMTMRLSERSGKQNRKDTHYISDMHHGRKATASSFKEAQVYYKEIHQLEQVDPKIQKELEMAKADFEELMRDLDRMADEMLLDEYDQGSYYDEDEGDLEEELGRRRRE